MIGTRPDKPAILAALALLLVLGGCHINPKKQVYHLTHRVVHVVVPDTVVSTVPLPVDTSYVEYVFRRYDLVDVITLDSTIRVNLQYADTTNFLKQNIYDGLRKAYLNCETALRVCAAQYYLRQADSALSLEILDASRPLHVQRLMWDSLKLTPAQKLKYLSDPERTSLHNYGCAVDVTIVDTRSGEPLDMGTAFDEFDPLSQPIYEIRLLRSGALSQQAYLNRLLLRRVMTRAGLNPITTEWWHFSLCTKEEAEKRFQLIL